MATIYDFKALSNRGKEVSLADYKGQVIEQNIVAEQASNKPTN